MDDCAVLYIGESSDFYCVKVPSQHAVVPDGDLFIEVDIANQDGTRSAPTVWSEGDHSISQMHDLSLSVLNDAGGGEVSRSGIKIKINDEV